MLQSYKELFLSQLHLESLLHGNMTPELALQLVADVEGLLVNSKPLLPSQQLLLREVKLPPGTCPFICYFVLLRNVPVVVTN